MPIARRLLLLLLMGGALLAARWANKRPQLQLRGAPLATAGSTRRRPAPPPAGAPFRPLAPKVRFAGMRAW